jgi:trimethylamine--corrinoid protein Co-methyltransferase
MATVVAGSESERRARPPICANICAIPPLSHDEHGIETALIYAAAGIPISFMAMPNMGSTAPASVLGAIVQGDAESVSAMVLMQLVYPGAPVFHSIITSLMNPRTGGYLAKMPLPVRFIAVQMAHAWGVPSLGGGSLTSDASEIGWQSAFDASFGSVQIPLAGGDLCGYLGLLNSSTILYPEHITLDAEIAMNVYETYKAFEFKDLDENLNVIKDVGPRGHYLRQKHTRTHMRDFHYSPIFDQHDQEGNLREPREVALEKFKDLEKNYHPEPRPQYVLQELDKILAAADKKAQDLGI